MKIFCSPKVVMQYSGGRPSGDMEAYVLFMTADLFDTDLDVTVPRTTERVL